MRYADLYPTIELTLSGAPPTEIAPKLIVDMAGEYLASMHEWRWLVGTTGLIDLRGSLSFTDGTWTEATKTLTSTGAFTSYSFLAGDQIRITGGTGVTTGVYTVSSRTSNDAIVLTTSLSTASVNLATGDIAAELAPKTAALPTDFRSLHAIAITNAVVRGVEMVDLEELLQLRTYNDIVQASWNYKVAVNWLGTPPSPYLELWPTPTANLSGALEIVYRKKWTRGSLDTTELPVPDFCEALMREIVKAFARGYVEEDEAGTDLRLAQVAAGPICRAAKMQDGMLQRSFGMLQGGGVEIHGGRRFGAARGCSLASVVSNPS